MSDFKPHVLIVNGYGCHTMSEVPEFDRFLVGYRRYLDEVASFINEEDPDMIIFCGGETQRKTAPGLSEAEIMYEYVYPKVRHTRRNQIRKNPSWFGGLITRWIREKDSYTTLENSRNAANRICFEICGQSIDGNFKVRITHMCEAIRAANVKMLDRHFMADYLEDIDDLVIKTVSWERGDPFKQAGNLIYNKLAITFPWLGLAKRERRRRIRRAKHI